MIPVTQPSLPEFDKYSTWLRSEAIAPILNKIGQFLSSIPIRNIVGQRKNVIDLREIMDEGKILLIPLAQQRISVTLCSLKGTLPAP